MVFLNNAVGPESGYEFNRTVLILGAAAICCKDFKAQPFGILRPCFCAVMVVSVPVIRMGGVKNKFRISHCIGGITGPHKFLCRPGRLCSGNDGFAAFGIGKVASAGTFFHIFISSMESQLV